MPWELNGNRDGDIGPNTLCPDEFRSLVDALGGLDRDDHYPLERGSGRHRAG